MIRVARRLSGLLVSASLGMVVLASPGCESPEERAPGTEPPTEPSTGPPGANRPAPPVDWSGPEQLVTGPAEMGPWEMNESRFHYVDDPTVRWLPGGDLAVAFVDNRRQNVYFQILAPDGTPRLDSPVDVSRSPEIFSWLPKIAVADGGSAVYVLWQEIVFSGGSHGGEAFFARSTDGGENFSKPLNLSETEDGDGKGRLTREIWHNGSLDIAVGPEGGISTAWTSYQGDLWFSRSTDGGESFSAPIAVGGSDRAPARGPDLAVTSHGALHLAWTVGEKEGADVRIARSDGGSSFDDPRIPFETEGHSDAPKIAFDNDGRLHLAFAHSPEGRFERYSVVYARRGAAGSFPSKPTRIAGPGDGDIESANFPALRVDGEGRAHLVWERYPDHDERPMGLGYARVPRGESPTAPTVVPGTEEPELGINGSLQGLLMQKLDVDRSGRIAVVNSRFDRGEASRIRLHLGRPEDSMVGAGP